MPRKVKLPDIQVIIPYKNLVQLLGAAQQVEDLRKEVKQNQEQMAALRLQFTEILELYRMYQD